MWNIIIGLILMIGGLSGRLALRGTNSGGGLAVLGGVLVVIGIVVAQRVFGWPWNALDAFCVAYLLLPVVIVVAAEFLGSGRKFERAMTLMAWGRYEEALAALRTVAALTPSCASGAKAPTSRAQARMCCPRPHALRGVCWGPARELV